MPIMLRNITYAPAKEDSGGRNCGHFVHNNGNRTRVLLEWREGAPKGLEAFLALVERRVPTDRDCKRPEEVRTLKLRGAFRESQRIALVYECPTQAVNLRDVIEKVQKPSSQDRRTLAGIIATKVRSLQVHFSVGHGALRPESFVFFGEANKPDLANPYLIDWGRPSSPGFHQHPQYPAGRPQWFYDTWSLLIILTEIAEWRLIDGNKGNEQELFKRKFDRVRQVTDPGWKGESTAQVFRFGFEVLNKDRAVLEKMGKFEIKRFYDTLCELLTATPAAQES